MSVLFDTSVCSLALRRDRLLTNPYVDELARLIAAGEAVITTGMVLQELLQGLSGRTEYFSWAAWILVFTVNPCSKFQ